MFVLLDVVDWVQYGKCKHLSIVVGSAHRVSQIVFGSLQFLMRSKKSGQKRDGGSDQGVSADDDQIKKQLREEQLVKEKAFAKQMVARKKLLARQKAWKENELKQEWEMRELKLQVQREMEEQFKEEMLDAEKKFLKKRYAIWKQFASCESKINALKQQECAVGGASAENPKQKVYK